MFYKLRPLLTTEMFLRWQLFGIHTQEGYKKQKVLQTSHLEAPLHLGERVTLWISFIGHKDSLPSWFCRRSLISLMETPTWAQAQRPCCVAFHYFSPMLELMFPSSQSSIRMPSVLRFGRHNLDEWEKGLQPFNNRMSVLPEGGAVN